MFDVSVTAPTALRTDAPYQRAASRIRFVLVSVLQTCRLEKSRGFANQGGLFERKRQLQQCLLAIRPAKKGNSNGQTKDIPGGNRNARIARNRCGSRASARVAIPVNKGCQMGRTSCRRDNRIELTLFDDCNDAFIARKPPDQFQLDQR